MIRLIILNSIIAMCYSQKFVCPNGNLHTDMFSSQVTMGISSDINLPNIILAKGKDLYDYTYNLPAPMRKIPSVAVSISGFQSAYSPNFDFHIRVRPLTNAQNITFYIKMDNMAANWKKLTFNFLAQIRDDVITDSYEITTNYLTLPLLKKSEMYLVPFREIVAKQTFTKSTIYIFINGFDLYSTDSSKKDNQFEVRVQNIRKSEYGLTFSVNSNSTTQIQKFYISYIMISNSSLLNITSSMNLTSAYGENTYDIYKNGLRSSTLTPSPALVKLVNFDKYKVIYGLSSFSIQNNRSQGRNFDIKINQTSMKVVVLTGTYKFNYLSNHFLLLRSPNQCSACLYYNFYDSKINQCVSICPSNSYIEGTNCMYCNISSHLNPKKNSCIWCGNNQEFNGTACVCKLGTYNITGKCIECLNGTGYNTSTKKCQCLGQGSYFDPITYKCACINGSYMNNKCVRCQEGWFLVKESCVNSNPCTNFSNTNWDGMRCACKQNFTQLAPNNCTCKGKLHSISSCELCTEPYTIGNGTSCFCKVNFTLNSSNKCECRGIIDSSGNCQPCNVPYSTWNGKQCICKILFMKSELPNICYCNGVIDDKDNCQECKVANTIFIGNSCVCKTGFTRNAINQCVAVNGSCTGTQFKNTTNKTCQSCPKGCTSCTQVIKQITVNATNSTNKTNITNSTTKTTTNNTNTTYTYNISVSNCSQCGKGYKLVNWTCVEVCGDSFRIDHQCDDNNTISGDGCSSNCTIEKDYTCVKNLIKQRDECFLKFIIIKYPSEIPNVTQFILSNGTRKGNQLYINVSMKYFPLQLINNGLYQTNQTNPLFLINTFKNNSTYTIKHVRYSYPHIFAITIKFSAFPTSDFKIQFALNKMNIGNYFKNIYIKEIVEKIFKISSF